MLVNVLAALVDQQPTRDAAFCSTVNQTLVVNGTSTHSSIFPLCLDMTNFQWSGGPSAGSSVPNPVMGYFNGTDRFLVNSTGGCTRAYFGKPKHAHMMPWHMVEIDPNAVLNRTEHGIDGFKNVDVWSVHRPRKPPFPSMDMEWRVESTKPSPPHEFLSSTAIQQAFPPAPKGELQFGTRDFSKDYVSPPKPGSFMPPPGISCPWDPNAFVPSGDCQPACSAGSVCCVDPSSGSKEGTCYGVDVCQEFATQQVLNSCACQLLLLQPLPLLTDCG